MIKFDLLENSILYYHFRLHIFGIFFGGEWGAWLIVCVTAERLICVLFPLHAKYLATRKNGNFFPFLIKIST